MAILAVMSIALVAVVGSVSGLNVAQQEIAANLAASQSQLLWIINGYTISLAALLLAVGAVGDHWGRRPVLLAGLGVFMAANAASAFSSNPEWLIVFRVLAGVGAAMIMPVTLSVITSVFPNGERGRAVGVWAGIAAVGGIIGLVLSAFLVDNYAWEWVFASPIVLAGVAFIGAWFIIPNTVERDDAAFDTVGSLLSVAAIGGLVLGIQEGPEQGWISLITMLGLVGGATALVAFTFWELRHRRPLIDPRVFANRALTAGSLTLVALFALLFGLFLVLVQFLQVVLSYSALEASVALLPAAPPILLISPFAPKLSRQFGLRWLLGIGAALVTAGFALLAMAGGDPSYSAVLPALVIIGVGVGFAMSPATTAITESLPVEKQGVASALNDTVREVGGAIGIAVIGSVLNAGYQSSVNIEGLDPELAAQAEDGIGGAMAVAAQLGPDGLEVIAAAQDAFLEGWATSMWVATALAALTTIAVVVFAPTKSDAQGQLAASDAEHIEYLDRELASTGFQTERPEAHTTVGSAPHKTTIGTHRDGN